MFNVSGHKSWNFFVFFLGVCFFFFKAETINADSCLSCTSFLLRDGAFYDGRRMPAWSTCGFCFLFLGMFVAAVFSWFALTKLKWFNKLALLAGMGLFKIIFRCCVFWGWCVRGWRCRWGMPFTPVLCKVRCRVIWPESALNRSQPFSRFPGRLFKCRRWPPPCGNCWGGILYLVFLYWCWYWFRTLERAPIKWFLHWRRCTGSHKKMLVRKLTDEPTYKKSRVHRIF